MKKLESGFQWRYSKKKLQVILFNTHKVQEGARRLPVWGEWAS